MNLSNEYIMLVVRASSVSYFVIHRIKLTILYFLARALERDDDTLAGRVL